MADYPHQSAAGQPILPRQQSPSPQPVTLVHQQPQDLEVHQQQALVAVQALERQRLKSLQDLVENPPL